jgi:hypothetical protein
VSDNNRSIISLSEGVFYQLTKTNTGWERCSVIILGALDAVPINLVISFFRNNNGYYQFSKSCEINHPYITFYTNTLDLFMRCNNPDSAPNKLLIYSISTTNNNCFLPQRLYPINLNPEDYNFIQI